MESNHSTEPRDEYLKLENQLCFPLYATSRLITRLYQPLLADPLEVAVQEVLELHPELDSYRA